MNLMQATDEAAAGRARLADKRPEGVQSDAATGWTPTTASRWLCRRRDAGPLAPRDLALQREGPVGARLQGRHARTPRGDARAAGAQGATPARGPHGADPGDERACDRGFDEDHRGDRAAVAGAAAVP